MCGASLHPSCVLEELIDRPVLGLCVKTRLNGVPNMFGEKAFRVIMGGTAWNAGGTITNDFRR